LVVGKFLRGLNAAETQCGTEFANTPSSRCRARISAILSDDRIGTEKGALLQENAGQDPEVASVYAKSPMHSMSDSPWS
jgi:hypothetical protein